MSKSRSTQKKSQLDTESKDDLWEVAITDAERMIDNLNRQIGNLKQSIQAFKSLREAGAPFPGQKALLGQDSDL